MKQVFPENVLKKEHYDIEIRESFVNREFI